MLRACILDFEGSCDVHIPLVEFSYNNSYHSSVRCASFKRLYNGDELSQMKPLSWSSLSCSDNSSSSEGAKREGDFAIGTAPGINSIQNLISQRGVIMIVKFATILSIKDRILSALKKAIGESTGLQKGLDEMIEQRSDGTLYYLDRIWVPLKGDVRTLITDEAHKSKYSIHPGANKMYYDFRDRYWWPGMKKDIAELIRVFGYSFKQRLGCPVRVKIYNFEDF
nr:putative reverse transcriptase domain-containing protein [Tanacetum cinerariifolium]